MVFLLSRELWQAVRHCARKAEMQADLWQWTAGDFGGDVRIRNLERDSTLSALISAKAESSRGSISIVAASSVLSKSFEHVIGCLLGQSGNLRLSLMLTSPLDGPQAERFARFIRENPQLQSRVSTFLVSARMDMELKPLDSEVVSERYVSFLRLLCQGGESLADALDLFRSPFSDEADDSEELPLDRFAAFPSKGIVALLGVETWIPRKEQIVNLAEALLSKLVAEEEKRAAIGSRVRTAEPAAVVDRALNLGQSDEPLSWEDFSELIPDPPPSELVDWKVPVSRERARKERRHFQRVIQRDFVEYTEALKTVLDEINERIYNQNTLSFSEALAAYRTELLDGIDLGSLSLLVRNYFPEYDARGETPLAGPEEEAEGWLPHESLDCFTKVYDTLEEGLAQLPTSRMWKLTGALGLGFLVLAWMNLNAELWVPLSFAAAGFLCPALLWGYRRWRLWKLRKELVGASDETFWNLRSAFEREVQWVIQQTRVQLERDIRKDATAFGNRLQVEIDAIPWLASVGDVEHDGIQEEIRQLRAALIGIGVSEEKLEQVLGRLEGLARRIVERAARDPLSAAGAVPEPTPAEVVEEWLDELVGTAVLPLEKVASLKDEILMAGGSWRFPPLMAPLTDADLHRGFRKVVILPDTDIIYQKLHEELPTFSGNAVVNLQVWRGPVPGAAACSVMTGLTESILESGIRPRGNGVSPLDGKHPAQRS